MWRAAALIGLAACATGQTEPEAVPPSPAEPPPIEVPAAPAPDSPAPPQSGTFAASHVLISWRGAVGSSADRTREEAATLAASVRERALAGAAFDALAREHSDDATAARGGALGAYRATTMVPAFEAAVAAVGVGEIAPVVETPFGFHVVRRDAVVEAHLAHIVVSWAGARASHAERSQADARAQIEAALAAVRGGMPFEAAARQWSDDATASLGGDLGWIAPGQMVPGFDDAAFSLASGATSDVIETPYGFHVIKRLE